MLTKNVLPLLLAALFLTGCASTVTNLTPSQAPRNPAGMYPFEATFNTTDQAIHKDTVKAYVLIGTEMFPMRPTPMLKDRWETLAPIPADKGFVNYRYKFDYEYNKIPRRGASSKLSPPYRLDISSK